MLKAALVGLPLAGKTTFFRLLSGQDVVVGIGQGKPESHRGTVSVPDERLQVLSAMFRPRKTTPAQIEVVDIPGVAPGSAAGEARRFLNEIREVDALVCVLRGFSSLLDGTPPSPLDEAESLDLELFLADLDVVQRRLERVKDSRKKSEQEERGLLERLDQALSDGVRIERLEFSEDEQRLMRGFTFLTSKPLVFVVNTDEAGLAGDFAGADKLAQFARQRQIPLLTVSAKLELEIAQLAEQDRGPFLAELGLKEPGIARLARVTYEGLGLISFLTAGEDEVRAWTVRQGAFAREAAGRIHSDLERGFIRAEVVAYDDLVAAGSLTKARELGKVRLEGKDYPVQDGDILNIRFHV